METKLVNQSCFKLIVVAAILSVASGNTIHLITLGYEHCVFNLLKYDQLFHSKSQDVLDNILAKTEGFQRWALLQIDNYDRRLTHAPGLEHEFFDSPQYLHEFCSVNIVVAIEACPGHSLRDIFGLRLYDNRNTFIVIHETICDLYTKSFSIDDVAPIFHFKPGIGIAYFQCIVCSIKAFKLFRIPKDFDVRSMGELRNVADQIKAISVVPLAALIGHTSGQSFRPKIWSICYHLSQNVDVERRNLVGCRPEHVFMENAVEKLNISVEYISLQNAAEQNHYFVDAPIHFAVLSMVEIFTTINVQSIPPSAYTQTKLETERSKFLYCVKYDEKESFHALFWIIPLDEWTWFYLGISCFLMLMLLRGQWFQLYSILMRQSCTVLNRNKWLIIFILAAIIFTYGYEGVISSYITVPPPLIIIGTLKELLGKRYKIVAQTPNNFNVSELKWIYQQENITDTPEATVVNQSDRFTSAKINELLTQCNTTNEVPERSWDSIHLAVELLLPGISCHYASNTVMPRPVVFFFFGYLQRELGQIGQRFSEAGILLMYKKYHSYLSFITFSHLYRQGIMEADKYKTVAFPMSDPKIASIFIGWALFLSITFLAFLLEIAFPAQRVQIVQSFIVKLKRTLFSKLKFYHWLWSMRSH